MGICKSRPWSITACINDDRCPPIPAADATGGDSVDRPPEAPARPAEPEPAAKPLVRTPERVAAERAERRRMAMIAAEANRLRNEMDRHIQALLASLPVSGLQETPRKGKNIYLAVAQLDWLTHPAEVRIRVFQDGGSVLVQIDVPRLRTRLTLPINSQAEREGIPSALFAIVRARID